MTDPTPTRAEVARYTAAGYDPGMKASHDGNYVSFTDYKAVLERAEAAEFERDFWHGALATANSQCYAARRAEAAAWNDAIEAAADFLHEQAADKGNTKTPQGRTAIFYRRKIRALRRAAPTDSRSWSATVPIAAAYHHDDVVRELVEAAWRAGRDAAASVVAEGWAENRYQEEIDEALNALAPPAALTKIAQEG